MNESNIVAQYDPARLLDTVIERMGLKNDAALSRTLQVAPSTITNVRNGQRPFNSALLICLHEQTGISIRELRMMLGDRRDKHRIGKIFNGTNR
jgi:hypothetical protein